MTEESESWFLVLASGIDKTQRTLMHELLKSKSADAWWHGYPDIWMVRGRTADEWREMLGVFVPKVPSAVLVFRLPDEGKRNWSARGARGAWEWVQENYASSGGGAPIAKKETDPAS